MLTADGVVLGVQTGPATLQIDQALQTSVTQQNAIVSNGQTTQTALQAIDGVLGTPGSGNDIGSLLGNLQNSFSTLLTDPSNQTQQSAVVSSATTLAQGINRLSAAYTRAAPGRAERPGIGGQHTELNPGDDRPAQQSDHRAQANRPEHRRPGKPAECGGADAVATDQHQDGRAARRRPVGVHVQRPDPADPLRPAARSPFANASTPPGSYYPGGGIPGIILGGPGRDQPDGRAARSAPTSRLRDTTLPTDQAELDEFAYGVSNRFASQGLTLFTDPSGNVPAGGGTPAQAGYVGYAGTIQVNPAVTADPSLVRDGTNAIAGSPPAPPPSRPIRPVDRQASPR